MLTTIVDVRIQKRSVLGSEDEQRVSALESMHKPQYLPDAESSKTRCSLVPASAKPIQATLLKI